MLHDLWKKFKTEKSVRIMLCVVASVLLLGGGSIVYAKYFSEGARWGVAIASGVYFTANYAAEVADDVDDDEFVEIPVGVAYQGSDLEYAFEVRNYENNLLFNEGDVEIPYSLSFWLGEDPGVATYYVTWNDGTENRTQNLGVGVENKVTIDNQSVAGGAAIANEYILGIATADSEHEAVPIYVEVETAPGAMIEKTLRGKMVLNGGSGSTHFLESYKFVVPEDTVDEDAQFAQIAKLSELSYEIRTAGGMAGEITEEIKISWDPDLLEINLFDEAYQDWLDSDTKSALEGSGAVMDKNGLPTDSDGWKYMTLHVMPYSAEIIGFFRGTNYNETTIKSMADLNAAVKVEKYIIAD